MTTIKRTYQCEWCRRKIGDPDIKAKKHYCSDRCRALHDEFIKNHKKY